MAPRYVLQIMQMMFALVRKLFADRVDLAAENLALRQQLAVLSRRTQRPRLNDIDRAFWAVMKDQVESWAGLSSAENRTSDVSEAWHSSTSMSLELSSFGDQCATPGLRMSFGKGHPARGRNRSTRNRLHRMVVSPQPLIVIAKPLDLRYFTTIH